MLLIWDIHITSRYQDKILQEITNFVNKYPEEKNIVFLWDYVYHFSYDRKAILSLYNLFIQLFESGKTVYILAWNHDRILNSFVFEEAQKAFDIIGRLFNEKWWKIRFITNVLLENIEWKDILFLPHSPHIYNDTLDKTGLNVSAINEEISNQINSLISQNIERNSNITIIHHHYFNDMVFPWQKSRFTYKDIAIDNKFLDVQGIKFISGHLHRIFTYKNYFCTWSLRNTSPLEENQTKILCKYDTNTGLITAEEISINPYISILLDNENLSESNLINKIKEIKNQNLNLLKTSPSRNIHLNEKEIKLNEISLVIKSDNINYDNFKEQIQDNLQEKIKDLKIKKVIKNMEELQDKLDLSGKNLATWFGDRKELLKEYLKRKYPTNFQDYEEILRKLKLFQ